MFKFAVGWAAVIPAFVLSFWLLVVVLQLGPLGMIAASVCGVGLSGWFASWLSENQPTWREKLGIAVTLLGAYGLVLYAGI